jgi:hypothetical protein
VSTWPDVLDSISAQIDLQRQALAKGTASPPDLEIVPPDAPPVDENDRLRVLALLDDSEFLTDLVVERLVDAPLRRTRPYSRRRS